MEKENRKGKGGKLRESMGKFLLITEATTAFPFFFLIFMVGGFVKDLLIDCFDF